MRGSKKPAYTDTTQEQLAKQKYEGDMAMHAETARLRGMSLDAWLKERDRLIRGEPASPPAPGSTMALHRDYAKDCAEFAAAIAQGIGSKKKDPLLLERIKGFGGTILEAYEPILSQSACALWTMIRDYQGDSLPELQRLLQKQAGVA